MAEGKTKLGIGVSTALLALSLIALVALVIALNAELPLNEEKGVCVLIDENSTYCLDGQIHVFLRNVCNVSVSIGTPMMHGTDPDLDDLGSKACIYGKTDIVIQPGREIACTNLLSAEAGNNSIWISPSAISKTTQVQCAKFGNVSSDAVV
jgi:hypothetical protein